MLCRPIVTSFESALPGYIVGRLDGSGYISKWLDGSSLVTFKTSRFPIDNPRTYVYTRASLPTSNWLEQRYRAGDRDSELGASHKPVARIVIGGPEAQVPVQRKGEEWETNPLELRFFFSTT